MAAAECPCKSDGVTVRRATIDDREKVMAINDHVYGGLDYLSDCYNSWMGDERHLSCLAEVDGKVVGL